MAIKIRVVNMIPQSQSNESNDDSETNIAVNPADPHIIGATAFTNIFPTVIFLSSDGGDTWAEAGIVPAATLDYNAKFSRNALYCGDLVSFVGPGGVLAVFQTTDPFSGAPMVQIDTEPNTDQPWMAVETVRKGPDTGKDRVYAAYTNWNGVISVATIDVSQDGTAAAPIFNSVQLQNRAVTRNAPSVRPAIHASGIVYAAYFDWRGPNTSPTFGSTISDVVVARDDNWGTGGFQDLIDPIDSHFGVRVATGFNTNFNGSLGPDRFGSDLALAVDPRPKHSRLVWLGWCDMQGANYTLHVRRSTNHGKTWSSDLLTVSNAKNPAIAVSSEGRVGVLYQQLTGPGGTRWEEHVQFTRNGVDWHDVLLANTAATTWTGDYSGLQAHGRDFYGTFATDNTPDLANFPHGVRYQRNVNFTTKQLLDLASNPTVTASIDPFFFKISWPEEEDEEDEERGFAGFERLEIEGLKYEKLSIKKLKLERVGEEDEDDKHGGDKARAISRRLWRIIDGIEHEDEEEEKKKEEEEEDE